MVPGAPLARVAGSVRALGHSPSVPDATGVPPSALVAEGVPWVGKPTPWVGKPIRLETRDRSAGGPPSRYRTRRRFVPTLATPTYQVNVANVGRVRVRTVSVSDAGDDQLNPSSRPGTQRRRRALVVVQTL
jgi:hypothetical protein